MTTPYLAKEKVREMIFDIIYNVFSSTVGFISMITIFVMLRKLSNLLQPIEGLIEYNNNTFDKLFFAIFIKQHYPFEGHKEFMRLLFHCLKLKNKECKEPKRYVACIAYTNAFTFGGAISDSVKKYRKYKRAWLAIIDAKIMAIIHDYFILNKKHYGIIYYIEEK